MNFDSDAQLVDEFRRCIMEDSMKASEIFEELQKRNHQNWSEELKFYYFKNAANFHINKHFYEIAQHYIEAAKKIAENNENDEWIFQTQLTYAVLLTAKSDLKNAIELLRDLLQKLPKENNELLHANVMTRLGIAHGKGGDLEEAVNCYLAALPYFDETSNPMRFGVRVNLITAYMQLGMNDDLNKIYSDLDKIKGECKNQSVLVFFHSNYAVFLNEQKRYEESLHHAEKALVLCNDKTQLSPYSIALRVKAEVLEQLGRSRLSYLYLLRNSEVLKKTTEYYSISLANLNIAAFLKKRGRFQLAHQYALQAYNIASTHSIKFILKMVLEFLAAFEEENKNYEKANIYLRQLLSVKEEILNTEKTNQLAKAISKYEIIKKEKEAENLRSQIAEYNLRLLRSQMNPHFIFNSINSINHFVLKNDRETASFYLLRFSRLMRQILDHSSTTSISIDKELDLLKNYLLLEQLRFANPFIYNIYVHPSIDVTEVFLPSMLLQPFVENSIKHGLKHSPHQGKIDIDIFEKNDYLNIIITDNGVGRQKAAELDSQQNEEKNSKAIAITHQRLAIINGVLAIDDILNKKNIVCGTKVTIKIPYEYTHCR